MGDRGAEQFRVGDRVSWNSEAGRVSGTIIRVHTQGVDYKGHIHHARPSEPQYEIKSSKTDHIALHRGAVLTRLND
ncbi:MAG TPA: DUF2945 domain-containing protein [Brevundimonas sp.]|nr:DUF2945 domain-containing protein [Brevundimonas sp.]